MSPLGPLWDPRALIGRLDMHPGLIILPSIDREGTWRLLEAVLYFLGQQEDPRDYMFNRVLEVSEEAIIKSDQLPPERASRPDQPRGRNWPSERETKRGMRAMPRERRRDRVGERSQGDRAEACAVLFAIEQDRMRPQMCDVGHASYVRIEHACGGQHPARHAERARLAPRRLVHELGELAG